MLQYDAAAVIPLTQLPLRQPFPQVVVEESSLRAIASL